MSHWIIAPILLPAFLAATLLLGFRGDLRGQRAVSLAGGVALLVIAAALLRAATIGGPEAYFPGDWPAPFGIVLMLDRLSGLMVLLAAALALVVLIYVVGTGWDARGRHFHALWQLQMMGLCGAFLTGDAFNLFVFFEVLLIASYGLMIHSGGRARLTAGVAYIAVNLIGSTLFLFALATLYGVTGTLNMADLAEKVAVLPPGDAALVRVAGVLLLLVFALKGALVPLHFWLPATYAAAPGPVAALFAVMTKVGAYAVLRVFTLIFPPGTQATGAMFGDLLLPAALITLAVGAVGVLGSVRLGRLVAFAAIASMGTLFVPIALFTPQATAAALYYLLHSTLATAALFLIVDQVRQARGGDDRVPAPAPFAGQGGLGVLFFAAAIAIAGLPPLSGFVGKLLILDASRAHMVWVWPVILGTSLMIIVGLAAAGSGVFWKSATPATPGRLPRLPVAAIILLLGLLACLTVLAGPVTDHLRATADALYRPDGYIAANALLRQD